MLPTGQVHTVGQDRSVDAFYHLILPATVLAIVNAAPLVRYTRASMLDVLNSEYVTTAKSKGLSYRLVIMRHAFRNGLIPIITIVALLIPEAVAGAVITEQVFAWNGMGSAGRQGRERPRPLADDGHHPDHRDRRPRRQHHRRHRIRRRRSTGGI